MPLLYTPDGSFGPPRSISNFVGGLGGNNGGGPLPSVMGGYAPATYLGQGQAGVQVIGVNPGSTVALGLLTCAGVVLASTNPNDPPRAWVYHAPSGSLTNNDVANALAALGNVNANDVVAVYAHPNPSDQYYVADATVLVNNGVPNGQVVEIESLPGVIFGINNLGQIFAA